MKPAPKPMLAVSEALDFLMSAVRPIAETEVVPTLEANGRVLAEAQVSALNVPSADNTQMDGYAVRSGDCASGDAVLTVSQRIPAGHVGQFLLRHRVAGFDLAALGEEGAELLVGRTLQHGHLPTERSLVWAEYHDPPRGACA